jgi:hypothetical protein
MMRTDKIVAIIVLVGLMSLAFVSGIRAQLPGEMKAFFSTSYPGFSLRVDATNETDPGKNVTLRLWANCTSSDVFYMECFNMSVYGFKLSGPEEAALYSVVLASNVPLVFNQTIDKTYVVPVPSDVYGPVFCRLYVKYVIADEPVLRNLDFAITSVRNIYYENLKNDFQQLNQSYQQLNETYGQLNQTYWELQENYTNLQKSMTDLSNTRMLATVFLVTTVFFVATTLYLTLRKPRESW